MDNYLIFTDSACDLPAAIRTEWGIGSCPLRFHFEGEDIEYADGDMDARTFYNKMRAGGVAKTSAVNAQTFVEAFEAELLQGHDILYIGFSSALSATCGAAKLAAEQLAERYPDRRIATVDSKTGSPGQALLIYLTLRQKQQGASLEEAAEYARRIADRISLWVTVEDLVYLKRGGRISATSAAVGGALNIKPIIHVNEEGKLVNVSKVIGRKRSIMTLLNQFETLAEDKAHSVLFLHHADCREDAELLARLLKEKYGVSVTLIGDIGPVIGAHLGPGGMAFCFVNPTI